MDTNNNRKVNKVGGVITIILTPIFFLFWGIHPVILFFGWFFVIFCVINAWIKYSKKNIPPASVLPKKEDDEDWILGDSFNVGSMIRPN